MILLGQRHFEKLGALGGIGGILPVDVDYFKQINDTCGHQTGDAVLHMVANCLKSHLRSYDMVARYGGDEFVAICVACSAADIDVPVRRILSKAAGLSVPGDSGRRQVTLSVGAAVISDSLETTTSEDLIAAADQCLYEAKRQGRGRGYRTEIDGASPSAADMTLITADEPRVGGRLRRAAIVEQPGDRKAEPVRQRGGKIRFTDRRRPTSGCKW